MNISIFRAAITVLFFSAILFSSVSFFANKLRLLLKTSSYIRRDAGNDEMSSNEFHTLVAEMPFAKTIEENLRYLTSIPRVAGTPENHQQAEWIASKFEEFGFDKVDIKEYKVLLSYPTKKGSASLIDTEENGKSEIELVSEETIYNKYENHSNLMPPFIAFSKSGTVEGELVYANFGDDNDFLYLRKQGIDLENCVALIRYGKFSRTKKIQNAAMYNVKGIIIYSDPEQYSPTGKSYPETLFLPEDGAQRGTALTKRGDPLSWGYPAIEGYHRSEVDEKEYLTQMTILPISYGHAKVLMSELDGEDAPDGSWSGLLDVPYKIDSKKKRIVRITTSIQQEDRVIKNVIATFEGEIEPDRLVILGNHRDSWTFGAADPGSGTATILEVARALAILKGKGWKPRRSILFCIWDAEEYGLIGSTEWAEEHAGILTNRAVSYFNVDSAVQGNYTIEFKSTPSLRDTFYDVVKMLKDPDNKTLNLYDSWVKKTGNKDGFKPEAKLFGQASDYMQFYNALGVSSLDLKYIFDPDNAWDDEYPVYHSIHDNFDSMKRFVDPDFRYHEVIGKLVMLSALNIADSVILPFNIRKYGDEVINEAEEIMKLKNKTASLIDYNIDFLIKGCEEFDYAASDFHERLQKIDKTDALAVRMANDKLMFLERSFVMNEDVPKERIRHMYHISGLRAAFDDVMKEKPHALEDLKIKMTLFAHHIRMATMVLQETFF